MSKKIKKPWKLAIKDKNYGVRGHKLLAVLEYVFLKNSVTYTELNKFSYNYTRRYMTSKKYNHIKNRGYIGGNLYGSGYIGRCLKKTSDNEYTLNDQGLEKLSDLRLKFDINLFINFTKYSLKYEL